MRKGKCAVIKTSTRQTVFLPLIGLVPAEKLKPGDLVGVNKDSYLVLDTLPAEFDSRVDVGKIGPRAFDPLWGGDDDTGTRGREMKTFWWEPFWLSVSFWDKQMYLPFREDRYVRLCRVLHAS